MHSKMRKKKKNLDIHSTLYIIIHGNEKYANKKTFDLNKITPPILTEGHNIVPGKLFVFLTPLAHSEALSVRVPPTEDSVTRAHLIAAWISSFIKKIARLFLFSYLYVSNSRTKLYFHNIFLKLI